MISGADEARRRLVIMDGVIVTKSPPQTYVNIEAALAVAEPRARDYLLGFYVGGDVMGTYNRLMFERYFVDDYLNRAKKKQGLWQWVLEALGLLNKIM